MNIEIDPEELENFTPENIAKFLFTKEPKLPCSCQIIAEQNLSDLPYIFEILLIIFLEGLEILTGDLSQTNLENFTEEHITILNPWFQSLGFNIKVKSTDFKNKELFKGYYCKTIIKDKLQKIYFELKQINKNYHFFLNGDYLEENKKKKNLNELFTVFISGKEIFKISFDFYYPEIQK